METNLVDLINCVFLPWGGPVRVILAYVRKSPETHAGLRAASMTISFEIIVRRVQVLSTSRSILCDPLVNRRDCDWDDLWDEPVDQLFAWRISVGSVIIGGFSLLYVTSVSS